MARFCSKCNKKIGFFEEDFDGMCRSCYNEVIEQERIRIQEEQKRKIKEEEERRLEEQRKKEEEKRLERKRIEKRNKQIEEEIRLEKLEKERKKQERKQKKLEEEQKRLEEEKKKEQEEQKRLEEEKKKEQEEQKRLEEQKKEEQRKKKEEQKRLEEEKKKEQEEKERKKKEREERKKQREEEKRKKTEKIAKEKAEILKCKILENPFAFYKYSELLINSPITENEMNIFKDEYKNIEIIIPNIIMKILENIPSNYNTDDLEKVTTIDSIINTMTKLEFMLKDENKIRENQIENIQNSKIKNTIISYDSKKYTYTYNPNENIISINDCINNMIGDEDDENIMKIKLDLRFNRLEDNALKLRNKLNTSREKYLDLFCKSIENLTRYDFVEKYEENEKIFEGIIEEVKIIKFSLFYFYAILFLYLIIINEHTEKVKENKDLYLIYENLTKAEMKREYITKKIFELYENFYANMFNSKIQKQEMDCIIFFIGEKRLYNTDNIKNISLEDAKENLKNTKTIKEKMSIIEGLISSIVNDNMESEKYVETIIVNLLNNIRECFDFSQLFTVMNEVNVLISRINIWTKSKELENERLRLLNGDLSKEMEIKKQELEYNSIQNGYEFEEYVANLYRKLGYTIEEVTKKSGDQRCRCNCL